MKLMFGCLGNGVTVCDTSNNSVGVCHISIHGHVRFYMEEQDIPQDCLDRIRAEAESVRQKFMQEWDKKSPLSKYTYMMEVPTIGCGNNAFMKVAEDNRNLSLEEQVRLMEPVFFGTHM